jgi:DNA polymerase I-like protein with 3'-5' exonuclease and polymerase domains
MIDQSKLQSFDVESWGSGDLYALQPFRARTGEAWLTSCAMAWFEQDNVLVRTHRQPTQRLLEEWLRWAAETKTYVVCWNGPFDVAWLIALGFRELVYQINWLDGILLQRHVLNAPKYRPMGKLSMGLKQTVEREYPNEAGYGDNANFNPQTEEEWDALVFYNGLDAKHTLTLAWKYLNLLSPQQVRNMLIEARSIPMVAEATVEGIPVNVPAAQKLDVELERTAAAKFVELKLRANVEITEALLRSPKQLRALLFDHWGLLPVKWTDHATDPQPSTDRESLLQLAVQDNRAALVNEYREANNNRTKFVTGVLASCAYNGDGKTRPAARIFGTYTGRMTYSSKTGRGVAEVPSGSPLHQWKRDPAFRDELAAPEGWTLLEFDFAGQEFRWMAVESGDPTMLGLCGDGEDAHSYMGAQCTSMDYRTLQRMVEQGDPEGKPKRQLGKVGNLSLQYRTSPKTLVRVAAVQHKVKLEFLEAEHIWRTYRRSYRRVPDYWRRQISLAKQLGYVKTIAGRRVQLGFPDSWVYRDHEDNPDGDATWAHESTAINFPIQGVGADQKYLAMLVLRDYLPKVDGRFAFELHDGLFVWVPDARRSRRRRDPPPAQQPALRESLGGEAAG